MAFEIRDLRMLLSKLKLIVPQSEKLNKNSIYDNKSRDMTHSVFPM